MPHRMRVLLGLLLSIAIIASGKAAAQKGKPADDVPGEAIFCGAGIDQCVGNELITATEVLVGIGGAAEVGQGAFLNVSNHEMWIGFGEGVYQLQFNLGSPDGVAPCSQSGTPCRLVDSVFTIDTEDGEFQSNVLGLDGNPSANGLLEVPIDGTRRTRLKIGFYDPWGQGILWGLNFNTIDYAGATDINVRRTDSCTWVFESGPNDRAGLIAFGNGSKGKRVRTDEGLYAAPLKLTFTTC